MLPLATEAQFCFANAGSAICGFLEDYNLVLGQSNLPDREFEGLKPVIALHPGQMHLRDQWGTGVHVIENTPMPTERYQLRGSGFSFIVVDEFEPFEPNDYMLMNPRAYDLLRRIEKRETRQPQKKGWYRDIEHKKRRHW